MSSLVIIAFMQAVSAEGGCTGMSATMRLDPAECTSWQRFFDSTGGLAWEVCSDKRDDPCACADGISGLTCDTDGHVAHIVRVDLENGNVRGTLDPLLGMRKLQHLVLRGNAVHGTLPKEMATLTDLLHLDLDNNRLTGTIPDLRRLAKLTSLKLFSNEFEGSFPPWLASATHLQQLVLSNNRFEGTVPDLSALTSLMTLFAGKNRLTGTLPSSLSDMPKLTGIDFFDNALRSPGDLDFHKFTSWCDLSMNAFTCPVTKVARRLCQATSTPCAPTVLSTSVAGNHNVTVFFEPPDETGGKGIRLFTVTSHPGGRVATGKVSPISVGHLHNGKEYTFTVTASNVNGESDPSAHSKPIAPVASKISGLLRLGAGLVVAAQLVVCLLPGARGAVKRSFFRALAKHKKEAKHLPL
jgi:hypothetical protein